MGQVGLGAACALAQQHLGRIYAGLLAHRDRLLARLVTELALALGQSEDTVAREYIRVNGI